MRERIDIDALKHAHPIAEVVASYGIALRPSGRALLGRCPFHEDGGRPNLHVYPDSDSFYCYRCCAGGDALAFVMRLDRVAFPAAVDRLRDGRIIPFPNHRQPTPLRRPIPPRGDAERACLAAAVELYQRRLAADPIALTYLASRGLNLATIERHRLGYASGEELTAFLRWRRLPIGAAVRVGLLRRDGRELFARRVVIPEIRSGQPLWLIGRTIEDGAPGPTYLGLPGPKPLLGWESARGAPAVYLVEGPFDWLTLRRWRFPALALMGTHIRPGAMKTLGRFERLYLVLDADDAGREATTRLVATLGSRAMPMPALPGAVDVADLGPRPNGRALFIRAIEQTALPAAA